MIDAGLPFYKSGKKTEVCSSLKTFYLNPYLTNGFSHHYHLGEYTFIIRGVRSDF